MSDLVSGQQVLLDDGSYVIHAGYLGTLSSLPSSSISQDVFFSSYGVRPCCPQNVVTDPCEESRYLTVRGTCSVLADRLGAGS